MSAISPRPASETSQRAMAALLQMKKIDIAALQRAFAGQGAS